MKPSFIPIDQLVARLRDKHPDAKYELDWDTPLHLLVATILAAQCTDVRVNKVTKTLFPKYPDARAFADADLGELEEMLKPTGAYRQKAKGVQDVCRALLERFGGEVPQEMAALITLPRVARKTANVVLNTAWNIASGVIVDTHVARVSYRMGLTDEDKPERIEEALMKHVPQGEWTFFGPALVLHGRYTCVARAPRCDECVFADACPRRIVDE